MGLFIWCGNTLGQKAKSELGNRPGPADRTRAWCVVWSLPWWLFQRERAGHLSFEALLTHATPLLPKSHFNLLPYMPRDTACPLHMNMTRWRRCKYQGLVASFVPQSKEINSLSESFQKSPWEDGSGAKSDSTWCLNSSEFWPAKLPGVSLSFLVNNLPWLCLFSRLHNSVTKLIPRAFDCFQWKSSETKVMRMFPYFEIPISILHSVGFPVGFPSRSRKAINHLQTVHLDGENL